MTNAPQGVHDFPAAPTTTTRARLDSRTDPHPLEAWSATELAKLPTYYVMDLDEDMPTTVRARDAVGSEEIRRLHRG